MTVEFKKDSNFLPDGWKGGKSSSMCCNENFMCSQVGEAQKKDVV